MPDTLTAGGNGVVMDEFKIFNRTFTQVTRKLVATPTVRRWPISAVEGNDDLTLAVDQICVTTDYFVGVTFSPARARR